jgi:cobalt/nickel transport system permease protein
MPGQDAFASGQSALHRLDARVKVVCAVTWSTCLAGLNDVRLLGLAAIVAAGLVLAARPRPRWLMRRMVLMSGFVAVLWLFVPWSVPGESVLSWGPVTITSAGVQQTLCLTLRFLAIVLACMMLLGTSSLFDVTRALQALRVPPKLVVLLLFCVRYVQLIRLEFDRMLAAARCRGFQPRTTLHTYHTYANLVGLLFVRSHDRAERIHEAMRCRGYTGQLPPAPPRPLTWHDVAFGGVVVGLALALVVFEWMITN